MTANDLRVLIPPSAYDPSKHKLPLAAEDLETGWIVQFMNGAVIKATSTGYFEGLVRFNCKAGEGAVVVAKDTPQESLIWVYERESHET